jgi:hypothetical protein
VSEWYVLELIVHVVIGIGLGYKFFGSPREPMDLFRGRNGSHLPTTQCACADFVDFATQRNGSHEKDLYKHGGPSSVSRAHFVTTGAIDLNLCTCVPLGEMTTSQISVRSDSWLGHQGAKTENIKCYNS